MGAPTRRNSRKAQLCLVRGCKTTLGGTNRSPRYKAMCNKHTARVVDHHLSLCPIQVSKVSSGWKPHLFPKLGESIVRFMEDTGVVKLLDSELNNIRAHRNFVPLGANLEVVERCKALSEQLIKVGHEAGVWLDDAPMEFADSDVYVEFDDDGRSPVEGRVGVNSSRLLGNTGVKCALHRDMEPSLMPPGARSYIVSVLLQDFYYYHCSRLTIRVD